MNDDLAPASSNQNASFRSMYKHRNEDGETNECAMAHIPIMQKMITRYSPNIDRLGVNHPDYVMAEYTACVLLHNRINRPVEKLASLIAACIQCNPINLFNDTEFMSYASSRAVG